MANIRIEEFPHTRGDSWYVHDEDKNLYLHKNLSWVTTANELGRFETKKQAQTALRKALSHNIAPYNLECYLAELDSLQKWLDGERDYFITKLDAAYEDNCSHYEKNGRISHVLRYALLCSTLKTLNKQLEELVTLNEFDETICNV